MPIYEFVCSDCNTVYQFFSKRVDPERIPPCPKRPGHAPLVRQMSRFAMGRAAVGGEQTPDSSPEQSGEPGRNGPDLDDPRMERAMAEMERDMEHLDENNPKTWRT